MAVPFRRIWLVCCDHSVAAVRRTRREAERFLRSRERDSIDGIEHYVLGPYVLRERSR